MTYVEPTLSASEIQTWLDCKRKWSFIYQDHLQTPSSPSAALGSKVHSLLEGYYHGDSLPYSSEDRDAAYIADSGLEHLPAPAEHLLIEHEFLVVGRHRYYGLVDLVDPETRTVYDHKTTSDFRWAKTEESLPTNVQAIIYATWAVTEWQTPEVSLQWNYMRTRGANASRPTKVTLTQEHVLQAFSCIEDIADDIAKHRGLATLDLPATPSMCESYGKCPFQFKCNLSPQEKMRGIMNQISTDDLLARLAAKRAEVQPGQINPPEAALSTVPQPEKSPEAPSAPNPPSVAETTPEKPEETAPRKGKKTSKAPIGTLYLNASVYGHGVTGFEIVLKRAKEIIADTDIGGTKYQDYRFIPYGQGPAVLIAAVLQALQERGRVEELVIQFITPEVQLVINDLLTRCDTVVRGT